MLAKFQGESIPINNLFQDSKQILITLHQVGILNIYKKRLATHSHVAVAMIKFMPSNIKSSIGYTFAFGCGNDIIYAGKEVDENDYKQ